MALPSLRIGIAALWFGALAVRLSGADAAPSSGNPIPSGDIRNARGFYSIVFYYTPNPKADTLATARALVKKYLPGATFANDPKENPQPPFVGFEEENAPLKNYSVPDKEYFKYAGHGLTDGEIAAIQQTSRATQLVLVVPKEEVWGMGRKFTALAHEFATTTGAYIWDESTRECFTRDTWKTERLDTWPETGIPDVTRQIVIHLYRFDDTSSYLRAVSLGMEKFALPDVVIERLNASNNRPAGNLINLVCQTLAEQPVIKDGASQEFGFERLKTEPLRSKMQAMTKKGAEQKVLLALLKGHPQEGDAENPLVEISFQNGQGNTEDEKREDILSKLWGTHDAVTGVKHDAELLQASKRAREKLMTLRPKFMKGLPPGDRLLVKAPFKTDDNNGNEWMWVEVMKWPEEGSIEGILQNDPFYVKGLKAGSKVVVSTQELFDYILAHADGTREGNETARLIEQQAGPKMEK